MSEKETKIFPVEVYSPNAHSSRLPGSWELSLGLLFGCQGPQSFSLQLPPPMGSVGKRLELGVELALACPQAL